MKPVHMEFIQSRRWRAVWVVALLAILVLLGLAVWIWVQRSGQMRDVGARIAEIKLQIQRAETQVPATVDRRQANTEQAIRFLRTDYNKVFAVVENLNEPGARLRAFALDASSNILRLEYDLNSVAKVSAITAALNAGYEARPWKLESINVSSEPTGLLGAVSATPVPVFRGVWSVVVDRL